MKNALFNPPSNIQAWLKAHDIKLYTIHADMSVDVDGDVYIAKKNLDCIPVQFNRVSGDFDCSHNQLVNLRGAPREVGGYFYCDHNNLINLLDGPREVGEYFYCDHNQLISLEGAPKEVGGYFSGENNALQNLEFCPTHVKGHFYCNYNVLLGDLQLENEFSVIYREHLKYQLIKQEKENLSNLIHASVKKAVGFKI